MMYTLHMHGPHFMQTHNRFTALWILSGTTWVSWYQKKHSPTHTHRGHQSSFICFVASSLFNQHTWQSFSTISLQVFFGLPLGLAPSTSYSIHFFIQSLSSFHNTYPYHRNQFCCSTEIMPSNHSLSINPLLGILSCSFTPFSSLPAEVPPQFPFLWARSHFHATYYFAHNCCTISLWLSMILIGKQWYQLPEFIPSNSDSVLHSCISISIHTQHVT